MNRKRLTIALSALVVIAIVVVSLALGRHSVNKKTQSMTKKVSNEAVEIKDSTNSSKIMLEFVSNHLPKEIGMVDLKIDSTTDDPQVMPLSLLQTGLLDKDVDAFISAFTVDNIDGFLSGNELVEQREEALHNAINIMTRNDTLTQLKAQKIKDREYVIVFQYKNNDTYKQKIKLVQNNNPGVDMSYRIQTSIKNILDDMNEN